jgi:hypothetical protein
MAACLRDLQDLDFRFRLQVFFQPFHIIQCQFNKLLQNKDRFLHRFPRRPHHLHHLSRQIMVMDRHHHRQVGRILYLTTDQTTDPALVILIIGPTTDLVQVILIIDPTTTDPAQEMLTIDHFQVTLATGPTPETGITSLHIIPNTLRGIPTMGADMQEIQTTGL